jgi:hypothetical protein
MVLNQDEIDGCRDAFLAFDKDRSGTIDVWELRQVLEAMGQAPTEDELFQVRPHTYNCVHAKDHENLCIRLTHFTLSLVYFTTSRPNLVDQ